MNLGNQTTAGGGTAIGCQSLAPKVRLTVSESVNGIAELATRINSSLDNLEKRLHAALEPDQPSPCTPAAEPPVQNLLEATNLISNRLDRIISRVDCLIGRVNI